MAANETDVFVMTIPVPDKCCSKCRAELGGSLSSDMYPWDIPVLGAKGWTCTLCDYPAGYRPENNPSLPAKSRESLARFRAVQK